MGGGCSLKKFMGLSEAVIPLRLRSGRLLRKGIVMYAHRGGRVEGIDVNDRWYICKSVDLRVVG